MFLDQCRKLKEKDFTLDGVFFQLYQSLQISQAE